ncbi:riboflavin synthase [Oribacterium sp. P6A1]|uniref:riboflavin synthase n=1 Tax=Oribacterium sp. P6A1 TaxID=1410612 RepID=UPI0005603986|nr:riboflavin synthase [Oribacterium sp. P6A1]
MFTGIVEERGSIRKLDIRGSSGRIEVQCRKVLEGTVIGDSIAVNGICLTVTELYDDGFSVDIMAETVRRSSLSAAKQQDHVNLERAMAANGRFGGHIVSGHIDGTGVVQEVKNEENAVWFTIKAPSRILRYIIEKGSIAIDGISLTVAYVDETVFKVSIIPHTMQETTLASRRPGDRVNLENDSVGKYVEKLLGLGYGRTGKIDAETGAKDFSGGISGSGRSDDSIEADGNYGGGRCGITMEFLEKYGI